MALNKDQILGADDLEIREEHVPEWGGTIRLKALSGTAVDAFQLSMIKIRKPGEDPVPNLENSKAKLLVHAIVDDNNEPLFTRTELDALGRKSSAVLQRLVDIVSDMSGLSDDAAAELAGNSEAAQSGDSPSS